MTFIDNYGWLPIRGAMGYYEYLRERIKIDNFDNRLVRFLAEVVDRVADRYLTHVIITMPPVSGKTTLLGRMLPQYWAANYPREAGILIDYNKTPFGKFGAVFPAARARREDGDSQVKLSTTFVTTPMMAPPSPINAIPSGWQHYETGDALCGYGADMIVVDDIFRNKREGQSVSFRETAWEWFNNTLMVRRISFDTPVVVIGTRYHPDDVIGRLLTHTNASMWTYYPIPLFAGKRDPLGRSPGESLNAIRFPAAKMDRLKEQIGPRDFELMYQHRIRK